MKVSEIIADLLARNFLIVANWKSQDHQLVDIDADQYVTLRTGNEANRLVPIHELSDIGFAYRLVPDRYLPLEDYSTNLASRFAVFCQLTDLNDTTASLLLERPVRLDELRNPDDWKIICVSLIGL